MKTYSLKTLGTSHTLPIPMEGANYYVNFEKIYSGERFAYFSTDNTKLQKAIEESQFWKSGEIKLVGEVKEVTELEPKAPAPVVEEADKADEAPKAIVNDEVTKFQDAKKILTSEPYKVPFQALSTPEKIFKKAAELGISFPNLPAEE